MRNITACGYFQYEETSNGSIRLTKYIGDNKNIVCPDFVGQLKVDEFGLNIFQGKKIDSIKLPKYLKVVGLNLLKNNGVKTIVLGNCIEKICYQAFLGNNFKEIKLNKKIEIDIDENAFDKDVKVILV